MNPYEEAIGLYVYLLGIISEVDKEGESGKEEEQEFNGGVSCLCGQSFYY